jgi:hypothetical protein
MSLCFFTLLSTLVAGIFDTVLYYDQVRGSAVGAIGTRETTLCRIQEQVSITAEINAAKGWIAREAVSAGGESGCHEAGDQQPG